MTEDIASTELLHPEEVENLFFFFCTIPSVDSTTMVATKVANFGRID
jgi:hypothetical protein